MYNLKKTLLAATALLSFSSNFVIGATEKTQPAVPSSSQAPVIVAPNEQTKSPTIVTVDINKRAKRDVNLLPMLWADTKSYLGNMLIWGGGLGTVVCPLGTVALCFMNRHEREVSIPIAAALSILSPLAVYGGYKLKKSGWKTYRDELIASAGL
ncbi:MAG: hypothetical protein NT124_01205 [Candidatus Dependentiae bacterium]|nr:hypothetical protein [Candidatus Dependentiae bacterium]